MQEKKRENGTLLSHAEIPSLHMQKSLLFTQMCV